MTIETEPMDDYQVIDAPIHAVDFTRPMDLPGRFCMSFAFDLDPLIFSIRKVGLIHPPIVRKDQAQIEIVTGYRRIMALKAMDRTTVPCRIVDARRFDPLRCLILNLHDNLSTRRLNDVEKGMVLSRLLPWVSRPEIISRYLPLLGLRPTGKNLDFFLEVERDGDNEIKSFIAKAGLAWPVVNILSDMDTPSKASLLKSVSNLNLNINQQMQFIEYIIDISHIEKTPIPHILSRMEMDGISQKAPNQPQQAKAMLSSLKARRYPTIVNAEKRFQKAVSDLHLPDGVRIAPPPFFEGTQYRLEVSYREGQELMSKLKELTLTAGIASLKNPWDEIPG